MFLHPLAFLEHVTDLCVETIGLMPTGDINLYAAFIYIRRKKLINFLIKIHVFVLTGYYITKSIINYEQDNGMFTVQLSIIEVERDCLKDLNLVFFGIFLYLNTTTTYDLICACVQHIVYHASFCTTYIITLNLFSFAQTCN